ncbi:MAG TPA: cell wall-active antibiotics response protein [Clostridiaceae bacterium]|jgi:predicted membrane protein|nr:cell wall-active antibiotics response protein [Clostridiaceae bacterium]
MNNKSVGRILWGVALVALGVIFAINALGIVDINIFFSGWWTLFIIVPSFIGLLSRRDKVGNLIGLLIGVALLLYAQGVLKFASVWQMLIPMILILIGLQLIFKSPFQRRTSQRIRELKYGDYAPVKDAAAFSAHKLNFDGQVFKGAVLDAVFGSIMCDLRNAIIEEDCVITASAVFAGIDIKVPDHVHVEIASETFFGGVSDKRSKTTFSGDQAVKPQTLYVEANCVFGGVDIS